MLTMKDYDLYLSLYRSAQRNVNMEQFISASVIMIDKIVRTLAEYVAVPQLEPQVATIYQQALDYKKIINENAACYGSSCFNSVQKILPLNLDALIFNAVNKINSLPPPSSFVQAIPPSPTDMTTLNINIDNTSTTAQSASKPAETVAVSNQAMTTSAIPVYDSTPKIEKDAIDVATGETIKVATTASSSEPIVKTAKIEDANTGASTVQQLAVNKEGVPVATVLTNADGTPKTVTTATGQEVLAVSTLDVPVAVQEAIKANARGEGSELEQNNAVIAKNTTYTELAVAVGVSLSVTLLSFIYGK